MKRLSEASSSGVQYQPLAAAQHPSLGFSQAEMLQAVELAEALSGLGNSSKALTDYMLQFLQGQTPEEAQNLYAFCSCSICISISVRDSPPAASRFSPAIQTCCPAEVQPKLQHLRRFWCQSKRHTCVKYGESRVLHLISIVIQGSNHGPTADAALEPRTDTWRPTGSQRNCSCSSQAEKGCGEDQTSAPLSYSKIMPQRCSVAVDL